MVYSVCVKSLRLAKGQRSRFQYKNGTKFKILPPLLHCGLIEYGMYPYSQSWTFSAKFRFLSACNESDINEHIYHG